jgi:hypothetical protein
VLRLSFAKVLIWFGPLLMYAMVMVVQIYTLLKDRAAFAD